MENASKALLISGSILLAILIISIGLYVYNRNKSAADASSMLSSLEINTHNSRYELYEGIQNGNNVKTILNYAIEDNEKLEGEERLGSTIGLCVNVRSNDPSILKTVKDGETKRALTTREYGVRYKENIKQLMKVISSNRQYKLWYSYTNTGYIWEIHIDSPS